MRIVLAVAVAFLLTVIQGTWTAGSAVSVNVSLIVAIHLGLTQSPLGGGIAAFVSGYIIDLTTGCPKGLASGQAAIAFFLSFLLTDRFLVRGIVVEVVYTLFVAALASMYAALVLAWLPARALFPSPPLVTALIHVGATGAAAPFVLAIVRRIDSVFERPKHRLVLR